MGVLRQAIASDKIIGGLPMNVHLTPELEQLVQAKVQSGRYNSASEVVREGFA
jgi:hypothetical protein